MAAPRTVSTTVDGGGILSTVRTAARWTVTFRRNTANQEGGALECFSILDDQNIPLQVRNSTFIENDAQWGGAIKVYNADVALENVSGEIFLGAGVIVAHNTAAGGAGIYAKASSVQMDEDVVIRENIAGEYGGGGLTLLTS
ncbi:hypothetical protein T484DRAFT_1784366, partial [Baffinella frigidus]